jgi:hypothetical protein
MRDSIEVDLGVRWVVKLAHYPARLEVILDFFDRAFQDFERINPSVSVWAVSVLELTAQFHHYTEPFTALHYWSVEEL